MKHQDDKKNKDEPVLEEIKKSFKKHHKKYGSPRITLDLQSNGIKISENRVARIMRANHLSATPNKKRYNSYKGEVGTIVKNVLNRHFDLGEPYKAFGTDVSQFKIGEDKLDEFNDFGNNFFIVPYFRWEESYEDGGYSTNFNYNKHHILSVSDPQNNNERFHIVYESKQLEFETDNTVYEYDETECASADFTAASLGAIVSKTGFDGLTVTYKPLTELSHIVYMLCRLDEISYSKKETAVRARRFQPHLSPPKKAKFRFK